jgi:hypothetical protein
MFVKIVKDLATENNVVALPLVAVGAALVLLSHNEPGMMVIAGGMAVLRGDKPKAE